MKKIVLLLVFFISALCCYAQSMSETGEYGSNLPVYSGLSFSRFGGIFPGNTTVFGKSIGKLSLNINPAKGEIPDLGLTKYATYKKESFFDTNIGPIILLIAGITGMIVGPIVSATSESNDGLMAGIFIFSFVGIGATAGSITWVILKD